MNTSDIWLLPDGMEELLPPQAERVEVFRRRFVDNCHRWGYQLVSPPLVEFLDSLLTGSGNDLDLQTFKLTDQLSGRLMGVRSDITPQVARMDASSYLRPGVSRLCYVDPVLHTRASSPLTSRSPIQAGCELFGYGGLPADLEIISLMLEQLSTMGLRQPCLSLSHVNIYRFLLQTAGLSPAAVARCHELLREKALADLDELVDGQITDPALAEMIKALPRLCGGDEVIGAARQALGKAPDAVTDAINTLEKVALLIRLRFPDLDIYYDLAELRGHNYHTGLVFSAYFAGFGEAIALGGRYDEVGGVFGRARPATGFSIDLRNLLFLTAAPDTPGSGGILAPTDDGDATLWEAVVKLRRQERVIQALPGNILTAEETGCDRRLEKQGDHWKVVPIKP